MDKEAVIAADCDAKFPAATFSNAFSDTLTDMDDGDEVLGTWGNNSGPDSGACKGGRRFRSMTG